MKQRNAVFRRPALVLGLLLAGLLLSLASLGPSTEDCQALCDWAAEVCDDVSSCMDDCVEAAAEDVDYARQCLEREVADCKSAHCCLRFTYEEYYWEQSCV